MEYKLNRGRLDRVLAALAGLGLSQMVISSPVSIDYLTGLLIKPFERLYVLYIRSDRPPVLIYGSVNGIIKIDGVETVCYCQDDDPVGILAGKLLPGRLGVDKTWTAGFILPLLKLRPDILPEPGDIAISRVRMVKDAEEQEKMRVASLVDDQVFERGFNSITGDETELVLSNRMGRFFEDAIGKHMGVSMVAFGKNASNPHHSAGNTRLGAGDCILIDSGKAVNKYMSDMTRTVFYKDVSPEHAEIYNIVLEANLAGIAAVKPGIPANDVDAAARKVITDAGYGPYFVHRVGHGIGMEGHEYPSIGGADCQDIILEPGMCFSVEPGIYLPGDVGVRVEDVVMVTETGVEVLNHYTKELRVIG